MTVVISFDHKYQEIFAPSHVPWILFDLAGEYILTIKASTASTVVPSRDNHHHQLQASEASEFEGSISMPPRYRHTSLSFVVDPSCGGEEAALRTCEHLKAYGKSVD